MVQGCNIKYQLSLALLLTCIGISTGHAIQPIVTLTGGTVFLDQKQENLSFANTVYIYRPHNSSQIKPLIGVFLGAEYPFNPEWAWQFGLAFYQSTTFTKQGEEDQAPISNLNAINTWNYQYKIINRQLLFENKLILTFKEQYHSYLLAGVGESFNYAYGFQASPQNSGEVATAIFADHNNNSLIYTLGFGIDIDIVKKLRLGAGYRFGYFGSYDLGPGIINTGAGGNIFHLPALKSAHSFNDEILIQLTYLI
jgi:opacity protein-like surface antigen